VTTGHADAHPTRANLLLPAQPPRAFAIYAFRRPPATGPQAASAIPSALAASGIAVLVLDLDASPPPSDTMSAEVYDAAAVRLAADTLRAEHRAPSLLIGHSAAGPTILTAAAALTDVRASVTIGSPAPRSPLSTHVPLLVLHAPRDPVVSASEAGRVFAAARHPKSFIALDGIDHAVSDPHQARHVARLIAAWAEPYLPDRTPAPTLDPPGSVVVTDAGTGKYTQRITAGRHQLTADEPVSVGGADNRIEPLRTPARRARRVHGDDPPDVRRPHRPATAPHNRPPPPRPGPRQGLRAVRTERRDAQPHPPRDRHRRPPERPDRRRLIEIADRCPVHRTLDSEIAFETTEA
jgi:hypothetical protein